MNQKSFGQSTVLTNQKKALPPLIGCTIFNCLAYCFRKSILLESYIEIISIAGVVISSITLQLSYYMRCALRNLLPL